MPKQAINGEGFSRLEGVAARAGTQLIDSCETSESHLSVVICKRSDANRPFVTWLYNHENDGFFQGNYHEDILEAAKDFMKRIADYN